MEKESLLIKDNAPINSQELLIMESLQKEKKSIKSLSDSLGIDYKNTYRYVEILENKGIVEVEKLGKGLPSFVSLKENKINLQILKQLENKSLTKEELKKNNKGLMELGNSLLSLSFDDLIVMRWEITEKGKQFLKEHKS